MAKSSGCIKKVSDALNPGGMLVNAEKVPGRTPAINRHSMD